MHSLTIKIKDSKNLKFFMDLLSKFNFIVEVSREDDSSTSTDLLKQQNNDQNKKYDFSDLIGKLEWKGDALKTQKQLRNEW